MTKYIFGNWKQNGNAALLQQIISALKTLPTTKNKIAIFPPDVYLAQAHQLTQGSLIGLGAQNVSAHSQGAYTGEVSATMLQEVGCQYVLVGHSERRQLFAETDQIVAEKFQQVATVGLTPVLCVGETLAQYEAGQTQAVVKRQLQAVLQQNEYSSFMIAYEPVWAIGTGKAATAQQAQDVHAFIRQQISLPVPLLYGGSVKPENAAELMQMPDIDGVLVGGAALDPKQFLSIVASV